jgi:glycosyltransferase involved in cell wall biosynthesis
MKVSVIVPVKNRASLLPITLNNILNQSHPPYEVIVVDDDSTDDLKGVIEKYKSQVIFIKSGGRGPGAARNSGVRIATGDAIQFFDSDDLMTNNKLEVQSELLRKRDADFVYGPYVKAVYNDRKWEQADVIMQYYPLPNTVLADLVLQGWCSITQSVLFSAQLIKEVGFWREDLMPHEDYEYWFRIGKVARNFCHENRSCVIYRQHQKQITNMEVSQRARLLDGIAAMRQIWAEIDYNPSLRTRLLFKGRYTSSRLDYRKGFGNEDNLKLTSTDYLSVIYYKLDNKLKRILTGTGWQPLHGVKSPGREEFHSYLENLV